MIPSAHNYVDILALHRFYKSPLGVAAAGAISQRLKLLWPYPHGEMVALGYGPPILDTFSSKDLNTQALMPARQGVTGWPEHAKKRAALVDEYHLPLPDNSINYIVLIHILEHAHSPGKLLREVWRVMKPAGRLVVIVPNRRRIWASLEHSPFGHGRPYSARQLHGLLSEKLLSPQHTDHTLFVPPLEMPGVGALFNATEWAARGWLRRFGGVLIVEAEKQVYGGIPHNIKRKQVVHIPGRDSVPRSR